MSGKMRIFNQNLLDIINSPEYEAILPKFHEKSYRRKEIIFYPNYAENNVFIVKKGKVRVFLASSDKEFTLSILEEGDAYSTHTRTYIQALDNCTLLICKTEDFGEIMKKDPAFTMNTVKVLGDLLKNSITIITNLAFNETGQRVKEYLLAAAEEKGMPGEKGIVLEIGLDIGQLAMSIGASRQTVSGIINEMYRAGVLERVNRKTVIIKDVEQLRSCE